MISFEISAFEKDPRALISVLNKMKKVGCWSPTHDPEVERVCCRTPSSTYNLCRFVNLAHGVSREAERVFLKNPSIGVRYLSLVNRRSFLDSDTQERFWKKVRKSPELSYSWADSFKERLPEDHEEIFVKNVRIAKNYSFFVIKGPFPARIHHMLILRSFEEMDGYSKSCLREYMKYSEGKV
jgi:hypothetical protein